MQVVWTLPARMFLEQLSKRSRETLDRNVRSLADQWEKKRPSQLKLLRTGYSRSMIYSFRVGSDLRVLLTRSGDALLILDLIRNSQINKLRNILPKSMTDDAHT